MEKISCIYSIYSLIHPDRIYIGSTNNFRRRKHQHLARLKQNKHHSWKLQYYVRKYGIDSIAIKVVELIEPSNLVEMEQYYIDLINPYFNILRIAGINRGKSKHKWTEEQKRNLSIILTGIKKPPLSQDHKNQISLRHMGNQNYLERKIEGRVKVTQEQISFLKENYRPWRKNGHKLSDMLNIPPSVVHRIVTNKNKYAFINEELHWSTKDSF